MLRIIFTFLALILSSNTAMANIDLKCISADVFDAGYYIVGTITPNKKLTLQIETINNWTGNTVVYSQQSEIVASMDAGYCENVIVDQEHRPATQLTVSMQAGPELEKLNGEAVERFAKLNCEISANLTQLMGCH